MTQVASVYAQALYELARNEGMSQPLLVQMDVLKEAFAQEPDFLRLLSMPSLSKEERIKILDDSFAGLVEPYLLNFLRILTRKGYMRAYPECCEAYRALYNEDHGILPVKVFTALPLSQAHAQKLEAKLEKITGKKVELCNVIETGCLGGVRLEYDGKRVDDTIRHRLDAVHSLLKNTIL